MATEPSVLILGAGVFGLTGALALRERGYRVTVADPGPVPHPMAASNDLSRMVRMDYGDDLLYSQLGAEAIAGWKRWNARWGREVYHEDGFLLLTSKTMAAGEFEQDSYSLLTGLGWNLERLVAGQKEERFPSWDHSHYIDGYLNPHAGWAEAGPVVSLLTEDAAQAGIELRTGFTTTSLLRDGTRVVGAASAEAGELRADQVVVAAGAWTPTLLPNLADIMWPVAQPIFYLKPSDPARFRPPQFPPWGADIPRSGWYGFPANQDGVIKIANHGPGRVVSPEVPRELQPGDEPMLRRFLAQSVPELAEAMLAGGKCCLYCDTWDGDFWIGRDPDAEGLVVATGGSGHAFKFGPVLGGLIADAVEGITNAYSQRFAWRPKGEAKSEAIRYTGE